MSRLTFAAPLRPVLPRRRRAARFALSLACLALFSACADQADTAVDTAAAAGSMEGAAASEPATAAATANTSLAEYELDMEEVDKYFAAFRNMGSAMRDMSPEARAEIQFDASDTDFNGYVARLEAEPVLNEAIRDAGLTAREFSLVLWSMLQAGMANAVLQSQPDVNEDSLADAMQVNMHNVRFMREHEAELRQKQESLDAELRRMGVAQG